MTYRLIYTNSYNKKAKKFIKKHPDLLDNTKNFKTSRIKPLPSLSEIARIKRKIKEAAFCIN